MGTNHLQSRFFEKELREIASEILGETGKEPWVSFGPCEVPSASAIKTEKNSSLSGFNSWIRKAISLARFKQNPLAETLSLWTWGDDSNLVLSLNLHPLQNKISDVLMLEKLHNVAVASVNEIGLDLHQTAKNESQQHLLAFVSGLGYRKHLDLIKKFQI